MLSEPMRTFGSTRLNAPSGAGCFLTIDRLVFLGYSPCLNAPSGAGCFLTAEADFQTRREVGLNAPCGAGCFLTSPRVESLGEGLKS